MTNVRVYRPQISVVLKKVVNRKETVAAGVQVADRTTHSEGTEIDLTKLIGQGNTVSVRRSVRGQDTGSFSISFPDQMSVDLADTIYGLVEPMDVIEIRMARDVIAAAGGVLPVVLRGFVSEVIRDEGMNGERPARTVTIVGHDYMKILQIIRLIYLPTMIVAQELLTEFKLELNYGVETDGSESAGAFVKRMIDKLVGSFIGKLQTGSGGGKSPVQAIQADTGDNQAPIMPFGVQQWEGGSVYDLLTKFGNVGPWNELYIEDRDDGPYLVYRPTPFKTASGDFIQSGASADQAQVTAEDLIALHVSRSDANVANYFWVDSPVLNLLDNPLLQQDQSLTPAPDSVAEYQNSQVGFYGTRLMRESSSQWVRYDGKSEGDVKDGEGVVLEQLNDLRRILIENNKDNVVLEQGTMRLKGWEAIKAGMYVTLLRGNFEASYYAHTVTHDFTMGGGFITTVEFDRGTGFIERLKRGAGSSPYLAELTIGGTYG